MVSVECEILSIECREETDNGDKWFGLYVSNDVFHFFRRSSCMR